MQQRPTRFYITQDEDHTVVRTVPMARRARNLTPPEDRADNCDRDEQDSDGPRTMAERLRSRIRKHVQ